MKQGDIAKTFYLPDGRANLGIDIAIGIAIAIGSTRFVMPVLEQAR